MKTFCAIVAVVFPMAICSTMWWRLTKAKTLDWKLSTCVATLALASSVLLLLASGNILFLSYKEAVLQVNDKAEQVNLLTDKNKALALLTARALLAARDNVIVSDQYNTQAALGPIEDLMRAGGATEQEIIMVFARTNAPNTITNYAR